MMVGSRGTVCSTHPHEALGGLMHEDDNTTEEWRPVPGHAGYEASSHGRVRSKDRDITQDHGGGNMYTRRLKGRMLKGRPGFAGYVGVSLAGRAMRVHQVIALTFIGPPPPGHEVRHKDGVPTNCRASNLEYGTRAQNIADSIRHGTKPRGEMLSAAKLTDSAVVSAREEYAAGAANQRELAERYGCCRETMGQVLRGERWQHVGGPFTRGQRLVNLDADDIAVMKTLRASGWSYRRIAALFGMAAGTARKHILHDDMEEG